jgi:hypothetical protein
MKTASKDIQKAYREEVEESENMSDNFDKGEKDEELIVALLFLFFVDDSPDGSLGVDFFFCISKQTSFIKLNAFNLVTAELTHKFCLDPRDTTLISSP